MGFFLMVCLGGAAGTAARFLLGVSVQRALGLGFPYGTLAVNLIGSFLIALVMHLGATKGLIGNDLRIVLCTGVLGGFTTYSSFNFETMRLWQQGSIGLGLLNMGATVVGCLIMGGLGLLTGRLVAGA
jgi:fluoride exporter